MLYNKIVRKLSKVRKGLRLERKLDLQVGQKVVVACINDSVRYLRREEGIGKHNIDKWTTEGEVVKIGRKIITVKTNGWEYKFDSTNDYEEPCKYGSPDRKLYLSKEEIIRELDFDDMVWEIKSVFTSYGKVKLSYEQVKEMYNIMIGNNGKVEI